MYKSKFKFLGEAGPILVTGLFTGVLAIALLIRFVKTGQDLRALIFVGPLLIFVLIFLWKKILTEMNQIEITELIIQVKNPFRNGYTILLIDNNDKIVAKINDYYYQDFKLLRHNLGLNYLGRVPTFIDRIIKIEN